MKSKGTSFIVLILMCALTIGIAFVAYFGLGSNDLLSFRSIKQGLDLSGGVHIVYEADQESVTKEEMNSAISLIQGRLNRKGYTEAEVAQQGEKRIVVDIPGVANAEEAISEIGQTAMLYFVDMNNNVLLSGAQIADARKDVADVKGNGVPEPYVVLKFNEEGKEKFAEATTANVGKPIAIVLDDETISSPVVNSPITDGEASITGSFTAEEAEELASLIKAGSLPFKLNILEMNNVGARLGANALSTSLFAGAVGIVVVLLFMLLVYRMSGLAADLALIIYIGLEILVLSAFSVTLTLPGIAGIILSIGMAVDANIVIFERIREEIQKGKSLRSSIDLGFKSALPAILDGNITTLIAAGVLFYLGTGTIKGFAQTLMIGIVISMFTALVITRIIVKSLVGIGLNNPKFYSTKKKI